MSSISCFSASAADWANAPPHSTSMASVRYRCLMQSSSVDLRADVLHELRVLRVFAAALGGELLAPGDPRLDAPRVRGPFLDVAHKERLVHFRPHSREPAFR